MDERYTTMKTQYKKIETVQDIMKQNYSMTEDKTKTRTHSDIPSTNQISYKQQHRTAGHVGTLNNVAPSVRSAYSTLFGAWATSST